MPLIRRLVQGIAVNGAAAGTAWYLFTRHTHFIPFSVPLTPAASSPFSALLTSPQLKTNSAFPSSAFATLNPSSNPPKLADCAERRVPLSKLKSSDRATLTQDFCRGIWAGWGFAYQRQYLERKWRMLPGREGMLWSRAGLGNSEYNVGTQMVDHFEVVERDEGKVVVRCGDSPLIKETRPSDGIFSIEVDVDEVRGEAIFRLKSIFFDSTATPEAKNPGPLPWWFPMAHREYTKLWMEGSIWGLLKSG